jgi:three-Cys-motif partner protein
MPIKNLHEKPFGEGTITKLEIFENYAKEWIPTFVMSKHKELWIFDFFAGTGYDKKGVSGSPIRILQQVKNQIKNIVKQQAKINVCFNEFDKDKFVLLETSCKQFLSDNPELERAKVNVIYRNKDFADLFPNTLSYIKKYPSLVYLDQNGIKFLSDTYLLELAKIKTTDFIYFLSSSYFNRFGKGEEFKGNIEIDVAKARKNPYKYFHKSVLEQIKERLPKDTKCVLYPFTIKKNANIYGIIFGATHPRAVDKFLKTAWNKNNINGEANFDIDDDIEKAKPSLFEELRLPTKIDIFRKNLRQEILNGNIKTNKDAFDYTLRQGHIPSHAAEEVAVMKKEKLIQYDGKSPLINYDQIYKNSRIIHFKVATL